MNKNILLLLAFTCAFSLLHAQVKLGAEIGLNSANVIEKNNIPGWDTSTQKYYSSKSGIRLGVNVEIPLSSHFYFQPGILYSSKGRQYSKYYSSAMTASTDTVYAKNTLQLGYMEMPLYLFYKIPLSANHKNNFFLGAGPYFGFIINATMNVQSLTQQSGSQSFSNIKNDLLVGNAVNKYKTFDAGLNAKAGFEFGSIVLSGFYSQGLRNFYTAPYTGTFHHKVVGVTLGIWLTKSTQTPKKTIQDQDKDGIPDAEDLCPLVPGLKKYHGCPIPDTDGDGIDDEHDSCKTIPGVLKYHGCPVPDTDGDGIDDEHDSCKTIPGVLKYHGCPVPDTDGDGIDDEHDSCKTVPGVPKYHGCPVPDRDGDGIPDDEDKCPDVKGVAENHGCPAIKTEIKKAVNYVAHNIEFATKSDVISVSSHIGLNDLANILKKHPELQLTIEGHTDSVGTAEHNMVLSQSRADAVKKYLINKGIQPARITALGMGMGHPIASNGTIKGRAKNRRVELKISN